VQTERRLLDRLGRSLHLAVHEVANVLCLLLHVLDHEALEGLEELVGRPLRLAALGVDRGRSAAGSSHEQGVLRGLGKGLESSANLIHDAVVTRDPEGALGVAHERLDRRGQVVGLAQHLGRRSTGRERLGCRGEIGNDGTCPLGRQRRSLGRGRGVAHKQRRLKLERALLHLARTALQDVVQQPLHLVGLLGQHSPQLLLVLLLGRVGALLQLVHPLERLVQTHLQHADLLVLAGLLLALLGTQLVELLAELLDLVRFLLVELLEGCLLLVLAAQERLELGAL